MAGSDKSKKVMEIASVPEAIEWQAEHLKRAGAENNARVIRALLAVLETDTATGRRMANWQGLTLEDAMPLRVAGGFHYLLLSGEEERLADIYRGAITDQGQVDALIVEIAERHDHTLLPWLDSPPQTNEAGRSASVMAALLWLSGKLGPKFELNEIGASAGINTMMARFYYDLGGTKVGPSLSSIRIESEWQGDPPPQNPVEIVRAEGCDIAPVDLTDEKQALRLKSYIWPEVTDRLARMDAAIAMAERAPPELRRMDAAEFMKERLGAEQEEGVTRVLFHTVMWQYMPEITRDAVTEAMEAAAAKATAEKPLAWIRVETNRETFKHELTVKYWPGGGDDWTMLAEAHPHGAWVEWKGAD
ncbi:DUF2332 domain-containing protein [Aurantiacibacter poecillastricola]|uniref:DUF2332 domain-containing protein n=1 Tax=Aurantiacibacter poecillastricola TaxID=3064385 RepID=UPI00273D0ABE|nr:DUF2332 domain-containing protein [Aurantiacibacter sp. 219JJ12-13]MDP5262511.1 DUF2332 domain-containing protein [Aurantiacibacter sp. 219JJ12-13]